MIYLYFGSLRTNANIRRNIEKALENYQGEKGIGIDEVTRFDFSKIIECQGRERQDMINEYFRVCDTHFVRNYGTDRDFVSVPEYHREYCDSYRSFTKDELNDFKKSVSGARDFFRAITDKYTENNDTPHCEVTLINFNKFKESVLKIKDHITQDKDLDPLMVDIGKWICYWSIRSLRSKGLKACVKYEKG